MVNTLSLPVAEIAVLLARENSGRALAEEAIANHEPFGAKLSAYSQWVPESSSLRQCG